MNTVFCSKPDSNQQAYLKDLNRRKAHSQIERKRRVKMSAAFDTLQKLDPKSKIRNPIQKLTILENAILYIQELETNLKNSNPDCNFSAGSRSIPSPSPSYNDDDKKPTLDNQTDGISVTVSSCSSNVMSLAYILN